MDYRTLGGDFLAANPHVFRLDCDGEIVFVKQRRPSKNPVGRAAQDILHRITGNPLLVPPPGPIGDNVSFEAGMLRRLAGAGVRVPRVLWQAGDYFVMSYAGPPLEQLLSREPERAGALLTETLRSLRDFHDRGFAHGGAIAKNFTVLDGAIHFIDFDDAIPGERLRQFQLRDVFLFLNSLETIGLDPDLAAWCRVYDEAGAPKDGETLSALREALLGLRIVKVMDRRFLDSLTMRDIRMLVRLVRKAEKL